METATGTTITYRKTKTGQWVGFAPASLAANVGDRVTVTKKDGTTKTEIVEELGKPFKVDNVEMVYLYFAPDYNYNPAAARKTPSNGNLATDRQVEMAARLINQGRWHDSDMGQGFAAPTVAQLRKMTRSEISGVIDDLKGSW